MSANFLLTFIFRGYILIIVEAKAKKHKSYERKCNINGNKRIFIN